MYPNNHVNGFQGHHQTYPAATPYPAYGQQSAGLNMYGQYTPPASMQAPNMQGGYYVNYIPPQQVGYYQQVYFGGLQNTHNAYMQTFPMHGYASYPTFAYPQYPNNMYSEPAAFGYDYSQQYPAPATSCDPNSLNANAAEFVPSFLQSPSPSEPQDQPEFRGNFGAAPSYDPDDLIDHQEEQQTPKDFWVCDRNISRDDNIHIENVRPIIEIIDSIVHFEHTYKNKGLEFDAILIPCQRKSKDAKLVTGQLELGFDQKTGRPFHATFVPQNETKFADIRVDIVHKDKKMHGKLIFDLAIPAVCSKLKKIEIEDSRGINTFLLADKK